LYSNSYCCSCSTVTYHYTCSSCFTPHVLQYNLLLLLFYDVIYSCSTVCLIATPVLQNILLLFLSYSILLLLRFYTLYFYSCSTVCPTATPVILFYYSCSRACLTATPVLHVLLLLLLCTVLLLLLFSSVTYHYPYPTTCLLLPTFSACYCNSVPYYVLLLFLFYVSWLWWSLWRPRHRCDDNIRIDLREIECKVVDWIHMAQDRDQ
jgi:hypothetical protein